MDKFNRILRDIKSLKIQGAENVAINGVKAFALGIDHSRAHSRDDLLSKMEKLKKILFSLRPTEPLLRNSIKFILKGVISSDEKDVETLKKLASECVNQCLEHFKKSQEFIAEIGSRRIENNMIVFTHCHSTTVVKILKKAKEEGKKFTVHNTETRPMFQGRLTAKELARAGIPVVHFIDSAARIAMKKSDIVLFGMDAVTTTKIYNKIGSEMFATIADKYEIPVYTCGDSWKFDPDGIYGKEETLEKRDLKEIWQNPPKGVKIENPSFERIDPNLVTAIISELGVLPHENFIESVMKNYPYLLPSRQPF
ncbi:MAG: translation initiation factor eIF-2B [Candidatus Aenigmarchaeota archaeon]|nr:translation initiation factor eIF-2B [Candidatus Aenigmarchaeota archaeon]